MWHGSGWFAFINSNAEQRPRVSWALVRRVLGYARPFRLHIVLVLVGILLSTLLGLVTPLLFRQLLDVALPNRDSAQLNLLAVGIVIVPLLSAVVVIFQRYLTASIGEGVIYHLRAELYAHLVRMALRFFTQTRTGELMSRLNNDVVGAQSAINTAVVNLIANTVTVIFTLAVMFALEWRLTLLGIVVVPLFLLPARRIAVRLRTLARDQAEQNARMNAMMSETLNVSGALLVKLFGRVSEESDRFAGRAARVRDIGVTRAVTGTAMFLSLGLISSVGLALVYWVGGHLALSGVFTPGLIVAFGLYLTQLYGPLQSLAAAPVEFASAMVSFERVFEVIDLPREIDEKPGALHLDQVRGDVVFEDVSFSYEPGEPVPHLSEVKRGGHESIRAVFSDDENGKGGHAPAPLAAAPESAALSQARERALENVTFHIAPGELAALVGPSGAGKTTITYLLPRLYDPTSGRILLDGHDLRDLALDTLARNIGMVTQETYLFHDTIRTNLIYARPDATDAEIEAAARAANIHDFIAGLPDGYDTIVGERGYRLSGGEKQRIAIARVILKDPRILVLDEATSHLDSQSEALIQAALEQVMQNRTSIVIAHRLSTILAADKILVIDRGRIVENGTHEELLAAGGLYARLYETQFKRETVQDT
ncbi:MAG: ABC transporter ATP-binding protein [Anaerolineae bacterium]|nr:ABC transporter ATP-binding protein [Anaerolineae bacterium]